MARSSRGVFVSIGWALVGALVLGVGVAVLLTHPAALGGFISLGLGITIVLGVVVRLIRAPKGKKMRRALAPLGDAGEVYQQLLTGREPTGLAIEHSFPVATDDKASSEN